MLSRSLVAMGCLAFVAASRADDPGTRQMLQARYDAIDAAIRHGDARAMGRASDRTIFSATDTKGRVADPSKMLAVLDRPNARQRTILTTVISADSLAGVAKAAVRIRATETVLENGRSTTYQVARSEEDTWSQIAGEWRLTGIHVTSCLVVRDGKVVLSEREHVLTDWERQYGHRPRRRA